MLFFTCDYNKSLIPQTDLRTINKYKRERNISWVTKAVSAALSFRLSHLFPSKAAIQRKERRRYEKHKNSKGPRLSGSGPLRGNGLRTDILSTSFTLRLSCEIDESLVLKPICCGEKLLNRILSIYFS